jgi:hypothetical protein
MVERVSLGRLVVAARSSHTTLLSNEPGLIVETIKSIVDSQL